MRERKQSRLRDGVEDKKTGKHGTHTGNTDSTVWAKGREYTSEGRGRKLGRLAQSQVIHGGSLTKRKAEEVELY